MSSLLRPWIATCEETMERMSDHLEQTLQPRTERRVLRHLARCERCRGVLASLQRTIDRLRGLGTDDVPEAPPPSVADVVVERIRHERR